MLRRPAGVPWAAPPDDGQFSPYGVSHWLVLAVFAVGAALLVAWGRRHRHDPAERYVSRGFAVLTGLLALVLQVYSMVASGLGVDRSIPLHLSDLAPPVAAYALWTHRRWAFTLTYYWCLSLSAQALFSPVLRSPDFPDPEFLAFWAMHLLVIWAAVYLTWGLGLRPRWGCYRIAVAVTLGWVAVAMTFNSLAGTNYGYLNRKPETGSILDLLGPWPAYLAVEAALVLLAWALMTLPWVWLAKQPRGPGAGRRAGSSR
ncbi:TIGR02206 family membrane protein [Prauserella muralis]|uniref:Uncharacterized protein n=1 Tax=Prauserella muralis TaxID=588067 RepID=A0A2V4B224_9PSEU|nr:TIGR02206 family membrane protein [Prauserella muralis]PXY22615.1 hypothetical protein BAY60_22590 [Prauserella muralis]TWE28320.1 putative integral membrane protein (TIGR02206 family) [Prauserella muralis]